MEMQIHRQQAVNAYFQSVSSYWRAIYQDTGLIGMIYQARRAASLALIGRLGLPAEARILEIGCGAGITTCGLACQGFRVIALDTVKEMLEITRQAAQELGVADRVTTRYGDIHALDFEDNQFHVVIAIGVIPWVYSADTAIRELERVVMPGGYVLVTADNCRRLNHLLDPWLNPMLDTLKGRGRSLLHHYGLWGPASPAVYARMHSPATIDRLLRSAGLHNIVGTTVGFGPFSLFGFRILPDVMGQWFHRLLQKQADRQARWIRRTGAHYIALAKKPDAALMPRQTLRANLVPGGRSNFQ